MRDLSLDREEILKEVKISWRKKKWSVGSQKYFVLKRERVRHPNSIKTCNTWKETKFSKQRLPSEAALPAEWTELSSREAHSGLQGVGAAPAARWGLCSIPWRGGAIIVSSRRDHVQPPSVFGPC